MGRFPDFCVTVSATVPSLCHLWCLPYRTTLLSDRAISDLLFPLLHVAEEGSALHDMLRLRNSLLLFYKSGGKALNLRVLGAFEHPLEVLSMQGRDLQGAFSALNILRKPSSSNFWGK